MNIVPNIKAMLAVMESHLRGTGRTESQVKTLSKGDLFIAHDVRFAENVARRYGKKTVSVNTARTDMILHQLHEKKTIHGGRPIILDHELQRIVLHKMLDDFERQMIYLAKDCSVADAPQTVCQ